MRRLGGGNCSRLAEAVVAVELAAVASPLFSTGTDTPSFSEEDDAPVSEDEPLLPVLVLVLVLELADSSAPERGADCDSSLSFVVSVTGAAVGELPTMHPVSHTNFSSP
ncbi:MAG: hypothetical protein ABWY05_17335 [Noviherbaspirillum sp.]